mmetsp:Transcript_89229/g.186485  ORF Transcript_89229/g.186485 Transcript_89229/m.186485 type:complete len:417 (-) Transcript_89229:67-1317(-)
MLKVNLSTLLLAVAVFRPCLAGTCGDMDRTLLSDDDAAHATAPLSLLQSGVSSLRAPTPDRRGDAANESSSEEQDTVATRRGTLQREGENQSSLVNLLETQAKSHSGTSPVCTSSICRCHRMLVAGSFQLTLVLLFVLLVVVMWGFIGCSASANWSQPPTASWFAVRCGFISLISGILVVITYYLVRRCAEGHLEFVHIPKNGGTSVEVAGLSGGFHWGVYALNLQGLQVMPDGSECSRHHVPPRMMEGPNPYRHAQLFCFTRSPYERALSEYNYLSTQRWGAEYATSYDTGLFAFPTCSEEGLNHFVQTTTKMVLAGRKYIDDCHHLPQTDYIYDLHGRRVCHHIMRVDEMPSNFERLMQNYGYPVHLPAEQMLSTSKSCPNLKLSSLTQETRSLIWQAYEADFILLNYSVALPA